MCVTCVGPQCGLSIINNEDMHIPHKRKYPKTYDYSMIYPKGKWSKGDGKSGRMCQFGM